MFRTLVVIACVTVGAFACGNAHLAAGRTYLAQGNYPLAIEVMDAGLAKAPGNSELRDAIILALQTWQADLRQDVDHLSESRRFLLALARLLVLEETSRRATEISLPAEDPASLEKERLQVVQKSVDQLQQSLDERAGRGLEVKADLSACNQLLALIGDDPSVARTCDRLRSRFKRIVYLQADEGSHPQTQQIFAGVLKHVRHENPELFEVVKESEGKHNAVMRVFVGEPTVSDSPYVMVKRDAYHTWIPKLNKRGKHVEEVYVERPSKKDIAEAKKKGKPAPKPKKTKKKVYVQAAGEYRHYRAFREVFVPYRVEVEDLRTFTIPVALTGHAKALVESTYHEYTGHPKARKSPAPQSPLGRANAPPIPTVDLMRAAAIEAMPERIVTKILERVE